MMSRLAIVCAVVLLGGLVVVRTDVRLVPLETATEQGCPVDPPADVSSPDVPADRCLPPNTTTPMVYFSDFAWRTFVALIWPAETGSRGAADRNATLSETGRLRVFDTFKADWELFTVAPLKWNEYAKATPCAGASPSSLVMAANSKYGNLRQFGLGGLAHALPSREGKWVTYQTAFNQVTHDQIVAGGFYQRDALGKAIAKAPLEIGAGGMNIKTAWVEITDPKVRARYYSQEAHVFDPTSTAVDLADRCRQTVVSLVGLHVVMQTKSSYPYWIWSTFEHVDNIPEPVQKPMAFHRENEDPMPAKDPNAFPPDWQSPKLYNVKRDPQGQLAPDTIEANDRYRKQLPAPWNNYQLVMTQWPANPKGKTDALKMFPLPTSAMATANPVFETFEQWSTCMGCHQKVKNSSYIWALHNHVIAQSSLIDPMTEKIDPRNMTEELRELQRYLQTPTQKAPK